MPYRRECFATRLSTGRTQKGGTGLFIGDPDTGGWAPELANGRVGAIAIRESFYPAARYLGRTADGAVAEDGPGTPDEVRRWLTGSADTGAVLHLACHAVMQSAPNVEDASYLLLAGAERMTAEEVLDAGTERGGRPLRIAILATCSTSATGHSYDEAFSLATAFLTAGAESVISTQWRPADQSSSVLMYMFHFYLQTMPPADALRAAQLWMSRPDRELPHAMPAAVARHVGSGPADLPDWAASSTPAGELSLGHGGRR